MTNAKKVLEHMQNNELTPKHEASRGARHFARGVVSTARELELRREELQVLVDEDLIVFGTRYLKQFDDIIDDVNSFVEALYDHIVK